jgi:hypothetical protein
VLLLALFLGTGYGLGATSAHALVEQAGHGEDTALYAGIVRDMRAGQGYYAAAATQLRQRGYAMASVLNWRLPTLAWLFALLPSDGAARALLGGLSLLALLAWYAALRRSLSARAASASCLLLVGLFAWPFASEAYRTHELWAGVGIAGSIAAAALGWPGVAVAAGLGALAVRELALPYVLVAMIFSLRGARRRETVAWLTGIAAFGIGLAVHAHLVTLHQVAGDRAQGAGWLQLGGWWFVLETAMMNFWLMSTPGWLIALVWPLALLGLLGWPGRLGARASGTVFAYVGLFLCVGLPFNHLWGLLYAGLVPLGLLRTPAVLRDLGQALRR